ncbi:DUF480 domain-containing protein [Erwinia piriflorinigrans]|uniref:Uncharacterized protein n=1 Tax=Erwinia piriflorinigrans CFBP 5888 TaxID=1161919 RepID=V5Z7C8_9GAMM|nr:DUF480 domain-containing protein [Erwinia piriflorinigrans]CCG86935.1 Protein of unknown function, DUF480 [Erwinia piriflorinigrans CFBP 5888]
MNKILFNAVEARVVGCLLEKQVTTPDQYPMSLNGVVTACNQKSNREPVMSLSDSEVQNTLDMLVKKHQLTALNTGSRVVKYEQRFCNSTFGQLQFSAAEVAIITNLLLRGAQTPGELRIRSARMHDFADVAEVEQTLERLVQHQHGQLVVRLAREPGKRESRYMHLLSGEVNESPEASSPDADNHSGGLALRVTQLEQQVATLQRQIAQLLADGEAK